MLGFSEVYLLRQEMWSADPPSPPLFFISISKGMGQTANAVYKEASTIAQKHDKTYSKTLYR